MRIAFLTFEFPDIRPGGVGAYVVKCARALAAIGHEPHIFTLTLPESLRNVLPGSVSVHEVQDIAERVQGGLLPAPLAAAALVGSQASYKLLIGTLLCDALRAEHRAHPFDVVEAAECEALALPLLVQPIEDLPVVVQIHLGFAANAFGNSLSPLQRDPLAEGLELALIVGADAVCAATQSVVDVTRMLCPFDREVEIIPHPVEISSSEPPSSPMDGAVLFVGRLQRRKGCDVFAKAANLFLGRNPRATVRFAGSDTRSGKADQSMLAEMTDCVDLQSRSRFIYLGELSADDVRRESAACCFQVVPSIVENFANTAVDAMALGRLVIYGGNTGLDEVVGDAGIRVWPLTPELLAEQMELAWNNPDQISALGRRALERVQTQFDAATVCQQRIDYFKAVIARHNENAGKIPGQWNALSALQVHALLETLTAHMAATAGLETTTATPGQQLMQRLGDLAAELHRPPHVWLFGAGRFTRRLLSERYRWQSLGLVLDGIIDDHPRFAESPDFLGLAVRSCTDFSAAIANGLTIDAIILSTDTLLHVFRERSRRFADCGIRILTLDASV